MIETIPIVSTAIDSGVWRYKPRLEWAPPGTQNWQPLEVISGTVSVDQTSQTRYSLSATVSKGNRLNLTNPKSGPLGLHPYGCKVRAFFGVQPLRANVAWLACGYYSVTAVTDSRDNLSISGLSEEVEIQGAQFPTARNLPDRQNYSFRTQAEILIKEAVPTATIRWDASLFNTQLRMPSVTVARERWNILYGDKSAASIANALGAQLYCDRNGVFVFKPVPKLKSAIPVATLSTGTYQVSRSNTWDRQNVHNLVVVTGQGTDGQSSIGPYYAWDSSPGSLTYAGVDPVHNPAGAGPYGVKPYFYNSSLITDAKLATRAADALLSQVTGFNNIISATTRFDPRLEVGDPIWIETEDGFPVLSMIDKISFQLDTGATSLTTRSTNALSAGGTI